MDALHRDLWFMPAGSPPLLDRMHGPKISMKGIHRTSPRDSRSGEMPPARKTEAYRCNSTGLDARTTATDNHPDARSDMPKGSVQELHLIRCPSRNFCG